MAHGAGLSLSLSSITLTERKFILAIDWGNVLYRIRYESTNAAFRALGIPVTLGSGEQHPIMNQMERGECSIDKFIETLQGLWTGSRTDGKTTLPSREEIIDAFNQLFNPRSAPDAGIGYLYERFTYLKDLKKRMKDAGVDFKLILLSNTNEIHATTKDGINDQSHAQGVGSIVQLGVAEFESFLFDAIFPSYILKARKGEIPSEGPTVVDLVLKELGVTPGSDAEIYLVDDSPSYCSSFTVACKHAHVVGSGIKLDAFGLGEMVAKVEAKVKDLLPETFRPADQSAYIVGIRSETEADFRSRVSAITQLTHFEGDVKESATPKAVATDAVADSGGAIGGAGAIGGGASAGLGAALAMTSHLLLGKGVAAVDSDAVVASTA